MEWKRTKDGKCAYRYYNQHTSDLICALCFRTIHIDTCGVNNVMLLRQPGKGDYDYSCCSHHKPSRALRKILNNSDNI
jgi:hypothetical protein